MTWMSGTIIAVIDQDTFDISVERTGGPYATALRHNERIRLVNREISDLRPMSGNPYARNALIGKKVYCEVHSRAPDLTVVVTARPM